jgi:glycosyltransferase involved in cell wall biosynthesis
MPKALLICDKGPRTSFGRVVEAFRRALESTCEVQVVWLHSPQYFRAGDVEESGDPVLRAPGFLRGRLLWPFQLKSLLLHEHPDWVFLVRPELGFLLPAIRKAAPRCRTTLMVHDTFAETLYPDSWKFRLVNRFWIRGCDRVDAFVFNSKWTEAEAAKVFTLHGPRHVVGCVVDPMDFHPPAADRAALRRKWDLPEERTIYLTLSLDEPRKNIATYFHLASQRPDALFLRVGRESPWMQECIVENGLGNVRHFHGLDLEHLRELYALSDAFVFPSLLEGFGIPPFEALSCGTPVVSSGTSAMGELLPGLAELVSNPEDVDAWLHALPQARLPESEVLRDALERHGPEAFRQRLMLHLDEVLHAVGGA